ncbi:MAG: hypothetical protein NC548_61380 [Lachnospiraceae bacterium]|nr:hypothetical protein [Lachnospiraceae bacterium]
MNDGVPAGEILNLRSRINRKTTVVPITEEKTISEIRIDLIKNAKLHGYDLLILGDFDDSFSQNRAAQIQKSYRSDIAFFYNDIYCGGKPAFTYMPKTVTNISQIEEENFLGLSNTAVNLTSFSLDFLDSLSDVKTNVFDWYFYSMMLLKAGAVGLYVPDAHTYYRQHADNIAGARQISYTKEIEVKLAQYSLLSDYYEHADYLLKKYKELASSESMIQRYIRKDKTNYWWSLLKVDNTGRKEKCLTIQQ